MEILRHRVPEFFIILIIFANIMAVGMVSSGQPDGANLEIFKEYKITPGLMEKSLSLGPHEKIRVIIKTKNRGTLKDDIEASGGQVRRTYKVFNGISAEIPSSRLNYLVGNPDVELITEDRPIKALLTESVPLINADDLWSSTSNLSITGKGQTVCVIDTGIDYNHPDLGGGIGPGYKVLGGYDFANDDSDPLDDNGHGTHVSGIIAANGSIKGVAPDANIVSVKILDEGGNGYTSDLVAGIEWCVENSGMHNISIISLSLGGDVHNSYCDSDPGESGIKDSIDAAVANDITVVTATGNDGNYNGVVTPACISSAIRVGAVYDENIGFKSWYQGSCTDSTTYADKIVCFTNRGPTFPDIIIAPGAIINSSWSINGPISKRYVESGGTSMAAPHVSGVIALFNQRYRSEYSVNPPPPFIFSKLNSSGVPIYDVQTGNTYYRVDALASVTGLEPASRSLEFFGTLEIDDDDAPEGTILKAYINSLERGSITTSRTGLYGNGAIWADNLAVNVTDADVGSTIEFRAKTPEMQDYLSCNETHMFHGAGTINLNLTARDPNVTINISLLSGWNMISIPLENISVNYSGAIIPYAYWFDPSTGGYILVPLEELQPGKGYWVAAVRESNLTVTGIPIYSYSSNLSTGWNIMGSVWDDTPMSNVITSPSNSILPYVYWFNPLTGSYLLSDTLEYIKGYWTAAVNDCTMEVG